MKCQILHPVLTTFVSQSATDEACSACHVTGQEISEDKLRVCGCLSGVRTRKQRDEKDRAAE
ncbi:MAG: hypothetical protein ACRD3E_12885 [Terriglobales bacterium]